jgi:hypothetical protein
MRLKWIVEFEVDESWVADGFELTNERASDMMSEALPYAYGPEHSARVLHAPEPDLIATIQGYKSAADRAERDKRRGHADDDAKSKR